MTDHHDVLDPQNFDRIFHHREAVQVGWNDEICHVAVDKDLAWGQADDLVGGDPTIGTTDPQISRCLLLGEPIKERRVGFLHTPGPGAIICKKIAQTFGQLVRVGMCNHDGLVKIELSALDTPASPPQGGGFLL